MKTYRDMPADVRVCARRAGHYLPLTISFGSSTKKSRLQRGMSLIFSLKEALNG